ncbi:hypothetical protein AT2G03180 [Arabidopsis thaliana]|uniref:Uncharacterized protein At2g03180 n=1 Tax=Arabidopsis thaliana TaxID=3702 RepID=O81056_ARATH|nr:uncharacterized protein AT2G03180 [Arabidopsis thaliana]AAC34484.1 hypothetical protein [Arabidopsis thaliana]AEC05672.1 hypothetical protein AT2G03180 [Arabidopsis thaliana]|eukprot:NP_178417.1 hypothetical protein AT2G03180 [Arabidopsis thaliana]
MLIFKEFAKIKKSVEAKIGFAHKDRLHKFLDHHVVIDGSSEQRIQAFKKTFHGRSCRIREIVEDSVTTSPWRCSQNAVILQTLKGLQIDQELVEPKELLTLRITKDCFIILEKPPIADVV